MQEETAIYLWFGGSCSSIGVLNTFLSCIGKRRDEADVVVTLVNISKTFDHFIPSFGHVRIRLGFLRVVL